MYKPARAAGTSALCGSVASQSPSPTAAEATDAQGMENEFVSAAVGGGGRIKRFPGGLIKGPRLEFWVEIVRGGRMYPGKEGGKCLETNRNSA